MALPKSFTKVTTFSKWLALSLFIILPILSFYYGIYYQQQTGSGLPHIFCKHWETVCDPNYTDPNGGCAAKKHCADDTNTPTTTPTSEAQPTSLNEIVELARTDLASNLTLALSDIHVVSAKEITWPDGSLGCPKPGMMYTQSLVEGYKIILSDGQKTYDYHASKNGKPFLCGKYPYSQ